MLAPDSPSGEGASFVVRRKGAGAWAWGSKPPPLPASSPCARAGLCVPGSSTGARGAGDVSNRAARSGAACSGRAPRDARGAAGRAGPAVAVRCCAVSFAEESGDVGTRARGAASSLPPAPSRGGAIGGGMVCCRWCSVRGAGRATRVLMCVTDGPRGEGARSVARRMCVGAWAWGPKSPLLSAEPARARIGTRVHGSSPGGGGGAPAVVD